MKFTIVFTTLLCVSTTWAVQVKKVEDPKDKREAQVGYGAPGQSSHSYQPQASYSLGANNGQSSHSYQSPATYSQGDASAISIGAGYSIGGAKPSFYGSQGSGAALQIPSDGLSPNGHATIQLPPITLQPSHGGSFAASDLSQIMSQLSHGFNTGGLSLQPSTTVAEFHQGGEGAQSASHGQELSIPQYAYGAPKYDFSQQFASAPAFTKGLGSYSATGPVLFTPSESQSNAAPSAYSSAQSLGDAAISGAIQSLGGASHNFGSAQPLSGYTLGAAGHSLGGSGHSFGGSAQSLGGSGHSFGQALGGHSFPSFNGLSFGGAAPSFGGSYKQLSGNYGAPSKSSFKPSAFLGASVQGEQAHALSGSSGSYSAPSLSTYHGGPSSLSGHGSSFGGSQGGFGSGSTKYVASYQPSKPEGLESSSALSSGHYQSPPSTTYGSPSYSANNIHAESSNRPLFVSTKYNRAAMSGFGKGSSSYRAPVTGHSSFSFTPKHSYGGSSSLYEPSDAHVSASETSYNTIKYSEELKPHVN